MSRISASTMTKVISGVTIGMVAGYSFVFSVLLLNIAGSLASVQSFFSSALVLMYLSVEVVFLSVVVVAAYYAVRVKGKPRK